MTRAERSFSEDWSRRAVGCSMYFYRIRSCLACMILCCEYASFNSNLLSRRDTYLPRRGNKRGTSVVRNCIFYDFPRFVIGRWPKSLALRANRFQRCWKYGWRNAREENALIGPIGPYLFPLGLIARSLLRLSAVRDQCVG